MPYFIKSSIQNYKWAAQRPTARKCWNQVWARRSDYTAPMLCCPSPPLLFLGGSRRVFLMSAESPFWGRSRGGSLMSTGLCPFCPLLCCRVDMSSHSTSFYIGCPPCSVQCSIPVPSFTKIFLHLLGRGERVLQF